MRPSCVAAAHDALVGGKGSTWPPPYSLDQYWKLDNPEDIPHSTCTTLTTRLRTRGFAVPSKARKERLLQLWKRAECGLLSYEKCGVQELRTFCTQRGLGASQSSGQKHWSLVSILEDADNGITFERFLDFAPELRVHIYTLLFDDFHELNLPTQPPITRVSRLLRKEALPLFYSSCTFVAEVELLGNTWQFSHLIKDGGLSDQSKAFFADITAENLRAVRKIQVRVSYRAPFSETCPFAHLPSFGGWLLDLGTERKPASVEKKAGGCLLAFRETVQSQIEDGFQSLVDEISQRPQGKALQHSDVTLIAEVFKPLWSLDS